MENKIDRIKKSGGCNIDFNIIIKYYFMISATTISFSLNPV